MKVANFSEIGRLKELMKRTDMDIARVSQVLSSLRPEATSVCCLKILVYEALSY